MAKGAYIGVSGKARKIKKIYIGVGGKARKVKKAYIGVNGKARLFWTAQDPASLAYRQTLNNTNREYCSNGTQVGQYVLFYGGLEGTGTNDYGTRTFNSYNGSLSQSVNQGTFTMWNSVCSTGVTFADRACFFNLASYSYYDFFYTSFGIIRTVNSSLVCSDVSGADGYYPIRSAVVVHNGSVLQYGGYSMSNGSSGYGTDSYGDTIHRYNSSFTHSLISLNGIAHQYYAHSGYATSIGNYAVIDSYASFGRCHTVNNSFTAGSNIAHSGYYLYFASSTPDYAIFTSWRANGDGSRRYLFTVNKSLTTGYVDSGCNAYESYHHPMLLATTYGDAFVTASVTTSSGSSESYRWFICNNSLTCRTFARTLKDDTDNKQRCSTIGVVSNYILRLGGSSSSFSSSTYDHVEVVSS